MEERNMLVNEHARVLSLIRHFLHVQKFHVN